MIIDLKEIQRLQKKYQNYPIAINAIQNMVDIVSRSRVEELQGSLAFITLMDLGVVKEEESKEKKVQQINS